MKIKVSDDVLVTKGKYKGKTGKVLRVFRKSQKITVEKINIRTKHIKKTATQKGQRIHYEAPFSASNVKILCPNCSKPSRIGYLKDQSLKTRICKKCLKPLPDSAKVKKQTKSHK